MVLKDEDIPTRKANNFYKRLGTADARMINRVIALMIFEIP